MQTDILKTVLSLSFIKEVVKKQYNLISINDVALIKSGSNDIYKIATKKSLYIFKIFNLDKTLKDLEFETNYILYLKANNILVSSPLETIDNKYFIYIDYPEGKKLAILTNYIEGNKLKYTSSDVYLFGINIAKLHNVSNSFLIPETEQKKYNIFDIFLEKKIIIENFLKQYYFQYFDFFSSFSNDLLCLKNIKFSEGYCHNDLHTDNTKITNNSIYLFDFDFSGYGYLIYELSVFKWSCILNNKMNLWKDFIKGYKSILAVNTQELIYIYSFVAMRDIIVMSFYINRINIIGHKIINSTYVNERMKFLKSINKQIIKRSSGYE